MPKYWEDFSVGDSYFCEKAIISEEDVYGFASLSEDFDPIYVDEAYAKNSPHGQRIVHGLLLLSKMTGLHYQMGLFKGTSLGMLELSWKFIQPVYIGDEICFEAKVARMEETSEPDYGIIYSLFLVRNQHGHIVQEGSFANLIRRYPELKT